jgi:hypothetical protein
MKFLATFLTYLIIGPRLCIWGELIMAGMSVAKGISDSRSASKQSKRMIKLAGDQYKINLETIALNREDAARNRRIAGYNDRLMEIEAEEAMYRAMINKALVDNDKDKLLEIFAMQEEDIFEKRDEALANTRASAAARGMDVGSVTAEALAIDQTIDANREIARLAWERRDQEKALLFESTFITHEAEFSEAVSDVNRAFLIDDAEYNYSMALKTAELDEKTAAVEKEAGIIEAKAVKAQGRSQMLGSFMQAGAMTFGSKEFRTDFKKKFG